MRKTLLSGLVACACFIAVVQAQTDSIPGFKPFLGLSVPYPKGSFDTADIGSQTQNVRNREDTVFLQIGADGRVQAVKKQWPVLSAKAASKNKPDSAAGRTDKTPSDTASWRFIEGKLKKVTFAFTSGSRLTPPIVVPVAYALTRTVADTLITALRFPVDSDLTTSAALLDRFFAANRIFPPRVVTLPKIFYRLNPDTAPSTYLTITARLKLSATGELADLDFPIAGQDRMTHQVQLALMHAKFKPFQIGKKALPCQFILTFRIFDNIVYPYSPTIPIDSSKTRTVTEARFMTSYYSTRDIWMPPIPRNFAGGVIERSTGTDFVGEIRVSVGIDSAGNLVRASTGSGSSPLAGPGLRAVRSVTWYPSVGRDGRYQNYEGRVRLIFDRVPKIVFIPEWLTR